MIHLLGETLERPEENLALDEALLNDAEHAAGRQSGILRFWEVRQYVVVLGHSGRSDEEIRWDAWEQAGISVLRRITGGGAVLLGPGCLNYTLVLSLQAYPELRD